jgi:hypothetical protein
MKDLLYATVASAVLAGSAPAMAQNSSARALRAGHSPGSADLRGEPRRPHPGVSGCCKAMAATAKWNSIGTTSRRGISAVITVRDGSMPPSVCPVLLG